MEVADRRGYLTLELETGKDGVLLLRYHDIDDHGDNDGHGDHDDYGDNDDGKISEPRAKNGKGHCPSHSFFNLFPLTNIGLLLTDRSQLFKTLKH